MRQKAISSLYPNVVTFRGDIAYDIHEQTVTVDDSLVAIEEDRLQGVEDAAAAAKANRLASVKSKLEALGLTTEEVKEAFGI